jgi:hypothetical protein
VTAQIPDTVIFRGEGYALIKVKGGDLFSPRQYGMSLKMVNSACWRGFYAAYEFTELGELRLRKATLDIVDREYEPIGGVFPNNGKYQNLDVPVPFTGKIRLAKGFIRELYVHAGFQMPSAFTTVVDLTLQDGIVVDVKDRSAEVEKKRGKFSKRRRSMWHWISGRKQVFSFDLDL